MKVVILNTVYNWGSTGYILRDLTAQLRNMDVDALPAASSTMGNPAEDAYIFSNPIAIRLYSWAVRLGWPRFWGSSFSTYKVIRFIKKENPDLVHVHLLNCTACNMYLLLKWLGKSNIKTVITHHAELYYTGSCGHSYSCLQFVDNQCINCPNKKYATGALIGGNPHKNWLRMKKAFGYFKKENLLFTSVSPWVKSRLALSPICDQFDCDVVMNGVETGVFYRREVPQTGSLLFVSANFNPANKDDVKGGWYLVELAKMMSEQQFVVVATATSNCENLPSNMHIHGKAKDQNELAELYSGAALTVLTSRRETFSMICAESLCCGTPIVGFKAGGPETISLPEYSEFVEQGDVAVLKAVVEKFLAQDYDRNAIAQNAHEVYSKKAMAEGYLAAYKKIMNQNN